MRSGAARPSVLTGASHGKHSHNDMVDMNWAKALYEELQNEMLAIHALIKAAKRQQPRS